MIKSEDRPLSGLCALLLRPRREPDSFADRLELRGCAVSRQPVLQIVAGQLTQDECTEFQNRLRQSNHVIVVSRPAAELLTRFCKKNHIIPRSLIAVGAATAGYLAEQGFTVSAPDSNQNSEGVLALPALQMVNQQSVLIVRGGGGRELIRQTLSNRGARVRYQELYSRQPVGENRAAITNLLSTQQRVVVVVHSVEILQALLSLYDVGQRDLLARQTFLVPGERVACAMKEKGLNRVIVSPDALPETMVDTLVGWYTETK